ncbi:MAG TPA: GNAT family N-acetyltransferase [Bryobacteraceae bacterium]|nr:GNAT family N-acetyltransferase [Bryobacteraceae bacterium]
MREDKILIRQIAPADAEAAAGLSAQLGYPVDTGILKKRIEDTIAATDHTVFVACLENTVVGWIDVGIVYHLATGVHGEICGLVVSSQCRSRGIGRKLVREAERWIMNCGISTAVVRSRITREAAHRFYLREGYSLTKTSAVFTKQLSL